MHHFVFTRTTSFFAIPIILFSLSGPAAAKNITTGKPAFLGEISLRTTDGVSDDLLTAGLGKTGLAGPSPAIADPANPTAAELRRLAIYNNYRALVDITAAGGYGTLYGPNVNQAGIATTSEGLIAGTEHIAYSDDGTGRQNVTMMVQVPVTFDAAKPCIVTGTSSGSRGIYGAIGTSGEWGLKNGCAVAYTDKGTGNGIHDLQNNTVSLQNGVRADAAAAGSASNFTANLTDPQRTAFNAAFPNRFAVKHAHSQQNPEKDWGKWTLQSVEFAFYVLNQKFNKHFNPSNTITIASSVSNGAGAALAAAEQDTRGLIGGVAIAEPSIALVPNNNLTVKRGAKTMVGTGKSLLDYFSIANLYQPCAALASPSTNVFHTVNATLAENRCDVLKANGLISGNSPQEMGASALNALFDAGYEPESAPLQASMFAFATPAIATTYSNTYGRFNVTDNLCNWSFSGSAAGMPLSFGTGNGIPPTAGIAIFKNNSVGGAAPLATSVSVSTGKADYDIDGAFCVRDLVTGNSQNAQSVQQGMREIERSGNLNGKPAIIVHGRSDTLIPVGFTSRPYYGLNKMVEGRKSKLRYIEVTNAQHFEAFLPFPGYAQNYLPLHRYFIQAMDLMYAHLKSHAALPESQVVRTIPRGMNGGVVNPISSDNVPPIAITPRADDRITFSNNTVTVPD
ncbi:MAG: D-(-)-3-hydroxybutyrate oligomer hydrolase [Burkholderiales bacterium RIFCSPLOWO2_02_FULL_57_36]|nr:MAG: D-(-)-3-hydroxybutyrate oligomer hydrolase [Burkholderiales bacterium RIFCSPLOWO2_02_FULL_57_36]